MPSLCIFYLHVAANNMKPLSVTMELQEWLSFALLLSYKIFRTAANNINVIKYVNKRIIHTVHCHQSNTKQSTNALLLLF
jgi:hypothetical protein